MICKIPPKYVQLQLPHVKTQGRVACLYTNLCSNCMVIQILTVDQLSWLEQVDIISKKSFASPIP